MLQSIFLLFLTIFMMVGCDSSESEPLQIDVAKPFSVYKGPLNDAPVPINQKVYLEFSASLDTNTVNETTAYMVDENNNSVGLYIGIGNPDTKIILTPYAFLEPSKSYTIVVTTALQDVNGRSLSEEYRYEFTTQPDSVDATPLVIKSLKPENGVLNTLIQSEIAIDFSKNLSLEPGYSAFEYIRVTNTDTNNIIVGKTEIFNSTLKFIPDNDLPYATPMSIELFGPILDLYANEYNLSAGNNWSFTTASEPSSPKLNEGFSSLSNTTATLNSYIINVMESNASVSKIAVARQGGIDIYSLSYVNNTGKRVNPFFTLLHSYSVTSQIKSMISMDNKYLVIGTQNGGIFSLKVAPTGVTQVSNIPAMIPIYGLYGDSSGKVYAVGPEYGLHIHTMNPATGYLTDNGFTSSNGAVYLDVIAATDTNSVKRIYVADYNGSVVTFDANGTKLSSTDMGGSVKKLGLRRDTYGTATGLLAITSLGKIHGIGFDGSINPNVKMNLVGGINFLTYYTDDINYINKVYYSDLQKGVVVTNNGTHANGIINTNGSVVSLGIAEGYSNKTPFLITLNQNGKLQVYNALADTASPTLFTTPNGGATISTNNPAFRVNFYDKYLDYSSITKNSFIYTDINNSTIIDFVLDISGVEHKLTPTSALSPNTNYSVTISGNVADLLGNKLNGGVDTVVNFQTNSDVPLVSISINDIALTEDSNGSFVVSLNEISTTDVSFDYETVGGTAIDGIDYIAVQGNATILAGALNTTILIVTKDDYKAEGSENFTLVLSSPTLNAILGDAQGLGTITDEVAGSEDTASISVFAPVSIHEGNTVTFTVATDKTALSDLKVNLEIQHIDTDSGDFNATSMSVIIGATNVNSSVSVATIDDSLNEGNESYKIVIVGIDSTLNGGYEKSVVGTSEVTTSIIDNDGGSGGSVNLYLSSAYADENASVMEFSFNMEMPMTSDITFDYATSDDTATAGSDYTATSGSALISAGVTHLVIDVPILQDTDIEDTEEFQFKITNVVNAVLNQLQVTGTITDDEAPL